MDKLGYACINTILADKNILVNRGMILKTFNSKGLNYVSELVILNVNDLIKILEWNEKHNIKNYRMSSDMFPFLGFYELHKLPKYDQIKSLMAKAGQIAKKNKCKLSFHPSPFNCLASPTPEIVEKTIFELEQHSRLMDLMELDASHLYNINIHIGGVYGNKQETMERFIKNFSRLSDTLRKRLTLENDDSKNSYTVKDLYSVYEKTKISLVFDSLHYYCNPGDMTYEDSFNLTYSSWYDSIPEIHHASSKKLHEDNSKTLKTHADFIYDKINTCGKDVWITIESKMKEQALLRYRKDFVDNNYLKS